MESGWFVLEPVREQKQPQEPVLAGAAGVAGAVAAGAGVAAGGVVLSGVTEPGVIAMLFLHSLVFKKPAKRLRFQNCVIMQSRAQEIFDSSCGRRCITIHAS